MILKRYGNSVQSVDTNFDSKALTEIGFRRNRRWSIESDEFAAAYELIEVHELDATADGPVQDETEAVMLEDLEGKLDALPESLREGEVLLVESEQGRDYPKTRTEQKNVIVEGENRFYFYVRMAPPPLRVGRYRRSA